MNDPDRLDRLLAMWTEDVPTDTEVALANNILDVLLDEYADMSGQLVEGAMWPTACALTLGMTADQLSMLVAAALRRLHA
jgi:hypothetical protein